MATINLNDQVRVKVTAEGRKVFDAYYRRLNLDPALYWKPRWDGRLVMPLWEVMHVFGSACFMGPPPPIEMTLELAGPGGD